MRISKRNAVFVLSLVVGSALGIYLSGLFEYDGLREMAIVAGTMVTLYLVLDYLTTEIAVH